eukprot:TRINITY_DN12239_c0_g1_i1.p2 TRINITY_DN12239_c0_g1~~TRINITY_DN12239_c0_g1_i1.p2  ORF type:complete len:101 (+),score=15.43 TRINITY_DN12239_c0_g1_i1:141-443(+)
MLRSLVGSEMCIRDSPQCTLAQFTFATTGMRSLASKLLVSKLIRSRWSGSGKRNRGCVWCPSLCLGEPKSNVCVLNCGVSEKFAFPSEIPRKDTSSSTGP